GNVLHVHDLVDYVAEEARRAGAACARWIRGGRPGRELRVKAGPNVRYAAPCRVSPDSPNKLYLRTLIVKNDAVLEVRLDNRVIQSRKKPHVQPSEMISVTLEPKDLAGAGPDSAVEIAIL
ncbi:MAG: pyridine nucleotide-disulfide oxidoreductase, partial [Treponema sp.]|nr:pyridine nucleotide-disulfide oxidoreductase [Treponema sp.]